VIDVHRRESRQARGWKRDGDEADRGGQAAEGWDDFSDHVARQLVVRSALADLPTTQHEAITLAYFEDLSQTQIAARLGVPLGTVKTRLRAALERLRHVLAPLPGAERAELPVQSAAEEPVSRSVAASR
jgi:RNA polymerase sigma-70 factor (ECF subfamily)